MGVKDADYTFLESAKVKNQKEMLDAQKVALYAVLETGNLDLYKRG